MLFESGFKTNASILKSELPKIIEAQAIFLATVLASGQQKKSEKAFKIVRWLVLVYL